MDQHQDDSSQNQLSIILPSSKSYSLKLFLTPSHSSASKKKTKFTGSRRLKAGHRGADWQKLGVPGSQAP